ncbi:MAG: hypothetical protein ABI432_01450 [Flavobacteriales bacterium]
MGGARVDLVRTIVVTLVVLGLPCATRAQDPFVKNDTTFLQRDTIGGYHAVFFAATGDSSLYDQVAWPIADLSEDKWVMSQRKALDGLGKKSPGVVSTEYFSRRDWVVVRRWKGAYCLYQPSDFGNHFRIQQFPRLIITDEPEGLAAFVVVGYPTVLTDSLPGLNYPCVSLVSHAMDPKRDTVEVRLHQLDAATGLTLWEFADASGDVRYELMIPRKNALMLPLIVNYSPARKAREWVFDEVGPELLKR